MSEFDFTEGGELPDVIEGVIEVVVGALPTLTYYEGDLDGDEGGLINLDEESAVDRLQQVDERDLAILASLLELATDRVARERQARRVLSNSFAGLTAA